MLHLSLDCDSTNLVEVVVVYAPVSEHDRLGHTDVKG